MSEKETPLTEAFFYILLALRLPNHGYGVIQEVEEKEYIITDTGRSVFEAERNRLAELLDNAKLMEVEGDDQI